MKDTWWWSYGMSPQRRIVWKGLDPGALLVMDLYFEGMTAIFYSNFSLEFSGISFVL